MKRHRGKTVIHKSEAGLKEAPPPTRRGHQPCQYPDSELLASVSAR